MLQQLEQCAVRKAFKVMEVNCTGSRAEANVREETGEKDTSPEREPDLKSKRKKMIFF